MSAGYPDGVTAGDIDRHFGTLSAADANEVERCLEERAEDEISRCERPFTDWLADSEHAESIARAAVFWPTFEGKRYLTRLEAKEARALNLAEAIQRMERDYIAYRVGTFTQDERAEVEAQLADERSAA